MLPKRRFWYVGRPDRLPSHGPSGSGQETFNKPVLGGRGIMPVATESRTSAPLTFVFLAAVLIANTIVFAQAGQGGAGGQRGAGAPAGAPAPGGQAPAAGPAAAAPAQGRGGAPAAAPGARGAAPVDLTGTWVSIVTEDWIERMSPDSPPSGVPRGGRGGGGGGGGRGGGAP